jgi:hypothetical protein
MAVKRNARPVVSKNVSDAVEQIILDAQNAGVNLDDIEDGPKLRGKLEDDQGALDELVGLSSRGAAIPGQSLTNDPEQPYPWEKPAEFANPRDALNDITASLLRPEAVKQMLDALVKGASVGDLAMAIAYAKFTEGKINPDAMLLIIEPVMYLIMGIAEEANIQYNIDGDDIDEPDEEEIAENMEKIESAFAKIQGGTMQDNMSLDNAEEVVDKSLLNKVKEAGPEIRQSLLEKGEE